jgi:hypothetical protein
MRDERPPVSPSSYRGFLSGHDGGYQPYERHFSYRDEDGRHEAVINYFLGVAPVPDGKTMELVPEPLHNRVPHTGGAAAIKAGQFDEVVPGGAFSGPERALGHAGTGAGFAGGGPAVAPDGGSGR